MTPRTHEPRATGTQERPPVPHHRARPTVEQAVPAAAPTFTEPGVTRDHRGES
ncbi:hypothetical protein [Streptomyces kanasensis]|uniref:hypothetical protein n=1 Tax=Streptomyces kanasensis TaxID=936756 RepID=UPI0038286204